MELSIIIVSYNTLDITRKCMQSIISQTKDVDYEIICVDNDSRDGSIEMIKKEYPSVILIQNKANLGFAKGQNIGISHSKGKYVLVLNSDVYFVGNVARQMIDFMVNGPADLGVLGPQVLNLDGTVATSAWRLVFSKGIIALGIINRHFNFKRFLPSTATMRKYLGFILSKYHDHYAEHNQIKETDCVDGMCLLVKREVLSNVGLFDEQFFFDSEIVDLSNRIRSKGWKIIYFPGAQVIHVGQASRKKTSPLLVERHQSELIYYAKYKPENVHFIKTVTKIVVAAKILITKASLLFDKSNPRKIETVAIYKRIQEVVKNFDVKSALLNQKIPSI
jgi:GT2 family glycosyltransferase